MALVGAFSVIVQPVVEPMDGFTALHVTVLLVPGHGLAQAVVRPVGPHRRRPARGLQALEVGRLCKYGGSGG